MVSGGTLIDPFLGLLMYFRGTSFWDYNDSGHLIAILSGREIILLQTILAVSMFDDAPTALSDRCPLRFYNADNKDTLDIGIACQNVYIRKGSSKFVATSIDIVGVFVPDYLPVWRRYLLKAQH